MLNNPEIFVESCFYSRSVDLRVRSDRLSINGEVVKRGVWMEEPVFVEVEDGAVPPVAIRLPDLAAQNLMDQLWKSGFRPTEGSGSAGALAATQSHLKDMQKLVFERKPSVQLTPRELRDMCYTRQPETDNSLYQKLTGEE